MFLKLAILFLTLIALGASWPYDESSSSEEEKKDPNGGNLLIKSMGMATASQFPVCKTHLVQLILKNEAGDKMVRWNKFHKECAWMVEQMSVEHWNPIVECVLMGNENAAEKPKKFLSESKEAKFKELNGRCIERAVALDRQIEEIEGQFEGERSTEAQMQLKKIQEIYEFMRVLLQNKCNEMNQVKSAMEAEAKQAKEQKLGESEKPKDADSTIFGQAMNMRVNAPKNFIVRQQGPHKVEMILDLGIVPHVGTGRSEEVRKMTEENTEAKGPKSLLEKINYAKSEPGCCCCEGTTSESDEAKAANAESKSTGLVVFIPKSQSPAVKSEAETKQVTDSARSSEGEKLKDVVQESPVTKVEETPAQSVEIIDENVKPKSAESVDAGQQTDGQTAALVEKPAKSDEIINDEKKSEPESIKPMEENNATATKDAAVQEPAKSAEKVESESIKCEEAEKSKEGEGNASPMKDVLQEPTKSAINEPKPKSDEPKSKSAEAEKSKEGEDNASSKEEKVIQSEEKAVDTTHGPTKSDTSEDDSDSAEEQIEASSSDLLSSLFGRVLKLFTDVEPKKSSEKSIDAKPKNEPTKPQDEPSKQQDEPEKPQEEPEMPQTEPSKFQPQIEDAKPQHEPSKTQNEQAKLQNEPSKESLTQEDSEKQKSNEEKAQPASWIRSLIGKFIGDSFGNGVVINLKPESMLSAKNSGPIKTSDKPEEKDQAIGKEKTQDSKESESDETQEAMPSVIVDFGPQKDSLKSNGNVKSTDDGKATNTGAMKNGGLKSLIELFMNAFNKPSSAAKRME